MTRLRLADLVTADEGDDSLLTKVLSQGGTKALGGVACLALAFAGWRITTRGARTGRIRPAGHSHPISIAMLLPGFTESGASDARRSPAAARAQKRAAQAQAVDSKALNGRKRRMRFNYDRFYTEMIQSLSNSSYSIPFAARQDRKPAGSQFVPGAQTGKGPSSSPVPLGLPGGEVKPPSPPANANPPGQGRKRDATKTQDRKRRRMFNYQRFYSDLVMDLTKSSYYVPFVTTADRQSNGTKDAAAVQHENGVALTSTTGILRVQFSKAVSIRRIPVAEAPRPCGPQTGPPETWNQPLSAPPEQSSEKQLELFRGIRLRKYKSYWPWSLEFSTISNK